MDPGFPLCPRCGRRLHRDEGCFCPETPSAREVLARELYAWSLGCERPPADMKRPSDQFIEAADRFLMGLQEAGQRVMPADEIEECERLRGRMAELLDRTANALKGAPEPLTMHSWHDLPEAAEKSRAAAALAGK